MIEKKTTIQLLNKKNTFSLLINIYKLAQFRQSWTFFENADNNFSGIKLWKLKLNRQSKHNTAYVISPTNSCKMLKISGRI